MKITPEEYNKKIQKILDDPNLQVHEKLIEALNQCGQYEIIGAEKFNGGKHVEKDFKKFIGTDGQYEKNYEWMKSFCAKIIKVIMSHPAGWEALKESTEHKPFDNNLPTTNG